jgi:hypothetical protein
MNNNQKRRAELQKAKAAKKQAMAESGGKSTYAKRRAARFNGAPMSTRTVMPWWFVEFSRVFASLRPEERPLAQAA